jgi:glycosyl transferase, family 25
MSNVFILNLKHRSDRREKFQRLNPQHSIGYEFVDAVDGRHIQMDNLIKQNLAIEDLKHYTAGALGCAMSHRELWQRCIAENRSIIIGEDDAILRGDFRTMFARILEQLPTDWDFVLLGYNFDAATSLELFPGVVMHSLFSAFSAKVPTEQDFTAFIEVRTIPALLPLHHAFGTCAYAISPQGAKTLLERCFPLSNRSIYVPSLGRSIVSFGIDTLLNTFYSELKAFCTVPPLGMSPNDKQDSDIQRS